MSPRKRTRRLFGRIYARVGADGVRTYYAQWPEHRAGRRSTRAIGTNRKEAEEFLDAIRDRQRLGTYETPPTVAELEQAAVAPVVAPAPTFVDFAQGVVDRLVKAEAPTRTVALYRSNLKALRAYFGDREVDGRRVPARLVTDIGQDAMEAYRDWRRTWRGDADRARSKRRTTRATTEGRESPKSVSAATINRDVQFAKAVLTGAVKKHLLDRNPLFGFEKLPEPRRARRFLSKPQVAALLLAAEPNYRVFLLAAIHTGARPGELRQLRWRAVDFENEKLVIYRSKVRNGDMLDLHPALAATLKRLLDARREASGSVHADDFVFLNKYGRPWQDMRRAWARTVRAAGLAEMGFRPYALRHTFACHYLTNGNLIDLQSQLGHSDVKTTMRYSEAMDERRKAGVLALNWGTPLAESKAPTARPEDADRSASG